jgi:protein-tyrosine phosphatase
LIDIHSHVLHGLDDGADTLEESVDMLRIAAESGTTDLVATPHANLQYGYDPERIRERLAELADAAANGPRLYSGCDLHLSYDNIQDAVADPHKYTINGKCYLLVEFSELLIFNNTPEIFAHLQNAGMVPVVTHPERNGLLRQRVENIASWVEAGARVQITGQSLLGVFGRRAQEFCETLLERGLVHFVASDAHDCEHRPPRLDLAYARLKKRYSESVAQTLCVINPQATLAGTPIEPTEIGTVPARRKWYQLWQ